MCPGCIGKLCFSGKLTWCEKKKLRAWGLTFVSEEVTAISLGEFYDTIDTTNLCGDSVSEDWGTNGGGLTEIKADEKYNTQMSITQGLCIGDVPEDLMLM